MLILRVIAWRGASLQVERAYLAGNNTAPSLMKVSALRVGNRLWDETKFFIVDEDDRL